MPSSSFMDEKAIFRNIQDEQLFSSFMTVRYLSTIRIIDDCVTWTSCIILRNNLISTHKPASTLMASSNEMTVIRGLLGKGMVFRYPITHWRKENAGSSRSQQSSRLEMIPIKTDGDPHLNALISKGCKRFPEEK